MNDKLSNASLNQETLKNEPFFQFAFNAELNKVKQKPRPRPADRPRPTADEIRKHLKEQENSPE